MQPFSSGLQKTQSLMHFSLPVEDSVAPLDWTPCNLKVHSIVCNFYLYTTCLCSAVIEIRVVECYR